MANTKNLFQRMSAITEEIATVAKNLSVGEGRSSYKAVGEADVLAAVKPAEIKHGVYSYPASRRVIDGGTIVNVSTYKGENKETKRLWMRVETVYRFVNVDKPEEFLEVTTYGDGVDTQDKAPGKAMTYGDKYALLKAYKIQTGDDPDQNASEPLSDIGSEMIGEKELGILRGMCEKKGLTPESVFKVWPKITKAQYVEAVGRLA